ncbi:MAG: ribonucleoside triphosphate reductase, partial [Coprobacillus sp.]|nr:ribonucleoside triphosphate reductase [Coprobacillus sp.]
MLQVKKRDGKIVNFNLKKISNAIERAFQAEHVPYEEGIIETLSLKVTSNFDPKVESNLISVEDIQDSVEHVLLETGYVDVAKSYMVYRKQHESLREIKHTDLDYK